MAVTKKELGKTKDGKVVNQFSITNGKGTEARVIELGAVLTNLFVKNDKGEVKDVVLGYDTVKDYELNPAFFGAIVGPSANRIANAKFVVDGVEYKILANDGVNNLHTDYDKGLHKQLWSGEIVGNGVKLTYVMPDLYVGLPGNIKVSVTYSLTEDNELKIEYEGVSDKTTIINVTNHSYFNLAGHKGGKKGVYETVLKLNASKFTEIVPGAIPTGRLAEVKGTAMDFTTAKKIGQDIEADMEQMKMVIGYDHNFAIDNYNGKLQKFAEASCDGRTMEVYTDLPGFQFYSGNHIGPFDAKDGAKYEARCGFCLETQYFPNSVNEPSFVSPVKKANEKFTSVTIYKFI